MKRVFLKVTYRHGRPIAVEITTPGRLDPEKLFTLFATLGQSGIERDELRPLVAA